MIASARQYTWPNGAHLPSRTCSASRRALADAHVPAFAAYAQLQPQQRQAHQQQHCREHRRIGIAEFQFELLIDRSGEGLQTDDRQRAEFNQHVQCDQE